MEASAGAELDDEEVSGLPIPLNCSAGLAIPVPGVGVHPNPGERVKQS
jgi:hypothetical protein